MDARPAGSHRSSFLLRLHRSSVPASHRFRQVRRLADQALDRLNSTFCRLYPDGGSPSIPPQQLLLALLLLAIYGIRSERMLIELLNEELMAKFLDLLLSTPEVKGSIPSGS